MGYELVMHRASVPIQLGYYLLRTDIPGQLPALYQRLGIKYRIIGDFSAGIYIRFYDYGKADWIEWTLGKRWRW